MSFISYVVMRITKAFECEKILRTEHIDGRELLITNAYMYKYIFIYISYLHRRKSRLINRAVSKKIRIYVYVYGYTCICVYLISKRRGW